MTEHLPIAVLGAGAAGTATALALAHAGHDVTLVDRRGLLEGKSNGTPARLGLGFHHADRATALLLLEHTIDFVTRIPGCTLADRPGAPAWIRHARYFVARDSLFSPAEIRSTHRALEARYAALWAEHGGRPPTAQDVPPGRRRARSAAPGERTRAPPTPQPLRRTRCLGSGSSSARPVGPAA
ncbi:FAD-dependent oxidoreductase [Curtobacterium sp. NPDC089689]|uniref:FAD-dependent oxidoreductase n=1 Tax=Curtobacterium sp. NPDC089689 TaxID=3363968 RepID=UPI0037F7957E